jgi:hypothetical protein
LDGIGCRVALLQKQLELLIGHTICLERGTNNHSVESGTCEGPRSTNQVLGSRKFGLEISLSLDRAIGEGASIVETLVDCCRDGRGQSSRNGKESGSAHCGRKCCCVTIGFPAVQVARRVFPLAKVVKISLQVEKNGIEEVVGRHERVSVCVK